MYGVLLMYILYTLLQTLHALTYFMLKVNASIFFNLQVNKLKIGITCIRPHRGKGTEASVKFQFF